MWEGLKELEEERSNSWWDSSLSPLHRGWDSFWQNKGQREVLYHQCPDPQEGERQWQQTMDKGSMGILTGDEQNLRDGEASQKLLKSLGKGLPSLLLARTKDLQADKSSGALYILLTSWKLRAGAEGRWETRTVLVHLKISISLNTGSLKGWTKGERLL